MRLVVLVGPFLVATSLMTADAQQNLLTLAGTPTYRFMVPVCAMASTRNSQLAAAAAADKERRLRAEFGLTSPISLCWPMFARTPGLRSRQ